MIWLVFFTVRALVCEKKCLDLCLDDQLCVRRCCRDIKVLSDRNCTLVCTEKDEVYLCDQKCYSEDVSCEENCQTFCESRVNDCERSCIHEFCEGSEHKTNWVYVIGLIVLFCSFIIGLFLHIDDIVTKSLSND